MILVTGAGGHLGANLVRRLLAEQDGLRVLLLSERERASVHGLPVEIRTGDLRDPATADAAVQDCRQVFHCAGRISTTARREHELFGCNVIATRNLLAAARAGGVEKVVVTGSFGVVGRRDDGGPSDETEPFNPLLPHLPYTHTKAAVEHECLKACADGLAVVIATSTAILGPHDFKPSRMGRVLLRFAAGSLRAYVPGGMEFIAARDIAQGHVLAMRHGRPGQRYIFSSQFLTFDDLMAIFARVTGRPPPARLPAAFMAATAPVADVLMPWLAPRSERLLTSEAIRILRLHRRACTTKARTELGFQPTPIEAAVQDAYDWFVAEGLLPRETDPTMRRHARRPDPMPR